MRGIAETVNIIMLRKTGPSQYLTPRQKKKNTKYPPLVQPDNIFLPHLHIKRGLLKNFLKPLVRNGDGFLYLKEKFPKLSEAKIDEGIFFGPQISQ